MTASYEAPGREVGCSAAVSSCVVCCVLLQVPPLPVHAGAAAERAVQAQHRHTTMHGERDSRRVVVYLSLSTHCARHMGLRPAAYVVQQGGCCCRGQVFEPQADHVCVPAYVPVSNQILHPCLQATVRECASCHTTATWCRDCVCSTAVLSGTELLAVLVVGTSPCSVRM